LVATGGEVVGVVEFLPELPPHASKKSDTANINMKLQDFKASSVRELRLELENL
jgi:hypothetical protein